MYTFVLVPGGGFEPPTRGFSIRCSTPELPGRAVSGNALHSAAVQPCLHLLSSVIAGIARYRLIGLIGRPAGYSVATFKPAR